MVHTHVDELWGDRKKIEKIDSKVDEEKTFDDTNEKDRKNNSEEKV